MNVTKPSKRSSSEEGRQFAQRLIRIMDERGIAVREAARIAGIPASTVSSWRAGALPTQFTALTALCKKLGVTMEFLLTGKQETRQSGLPAIAEVFDDGGEIFNGYAHIKILRLLPKDRKGDKK